MNLSKKSILITLFLSLFASSVYASDFCDGFKSGYISGYKQAKGTSISPSVPICSFKPIKMLGDPKSDFEFGYTIGFKKGMAEGHN